MVPNHPLKLNFCGLPSKIVSYHSKNFCTNSDLVQCFVIIFLLTDLTLRKGLTLLSAELNVVQSLLTFNVLTNNVSMLDQMRKGLSLLGLLEEIEKNPNLFEHFFVHQGSRFTPAYVKELLTIKECCTDGATVEDAERYIRLLFSFIETVMRKNYLTYYSLSLIPLKPAVHYLDQSRYISLILMPYFPQHIWWKSRSQHPSKPKKNLIWQSKLLQRGIY